jgi:signal transduction histidine kinase
MMERVVQNLMVNALAYTPERGVIVVRLERVVEELVLTVANEGPALPMELVRWMNTSGAERPDRAAIGLAIVRKILLLHGFGFFVEIKEGKNVFAIRMGVFKKE